MCALGLSNPLFTQTRFSNFQKPLSFFTSVQNSGLIPVELPWTCCCLLFMALRFYNSLRSLLYLVQCIYQPYEKLSLKIFKVINQKLF